MLQGFVHYGLHFLVPVAISLILYKKQWIKISAILIATMLVDLDHLLATPVFDPSRCSIGFHLLHQPLAIISYTILLLFPKTRIISLGLLLHMVTDKIDCIWMASI